MQGSASSIHKDFQNSFFQKTFNLETSFGGLFLAIVMYISCYFPALFFLVVVFLILEPLGVDFELPRGPSHPQKCSFYIEKPTCLIQRGFALKDALEGALGCLLGSFWGIWGGEGWGLFWCQHGFDLAPRISKTCFLGTLEPPRGTPRTLKTKPREQ